MLVKLGRISVEIIKHIILTTSSGGRNIGKVMHGSNLFKVFLF